jgi:tetratricopeptide (TPR) repeat protein/predicted Ser/Thr protein kinase
MSDSRTPASSDGDATLAGDGVPSAPREGPRWPARLGHYVMLQELGHGGMGVVCAAYDQVLDRKVAIKLLHGRSDEQAQIRLVREAQALARLSHPNVVQIYEIGELERLAFIVMEFVDGVTLREWLGSEPRSREAILAVFDAAGRGLAAAHAEGLVHRDFKPDNVMIRHDGRVLVMDFGLARGEVPGEPGMPGMAGMAGAATIPVDELAEVGSTLGSSRGNQLSVDLTRTGSLLGTPAYMAPEQFRGLETDAKTDQFAFCVASWEALTGARPFAGTHVAALALAVTKGTIATPPPGLPSWIRKHLERGLAGDPSQRWPSMEALLTALRDDPTRRRRAWVAALGVVVIGVGIAFGLGLARERERVATRAACEAEGRAIADDWSADDRDVIERAFVAIDPSAGLETWVRVQSSMAAYAETWTQLRTSACVDAHGEPAEPARRPIDYAALTDCLDEHRTTFATLVDTWREPERAQVFAAASAAASLPVLSTCSDPALLAARARLPDDTDTRASVKSLRHRLERIRALALALDYEVGLREAEVVLSEAEALGWPPLVAEARLELAHMLQYLGRFDEAHVAMRQAFGEAGEAGHDRVALEAATSLIYVVGHQLAKPEPGLVWSEITGMLIGRLGLAGSLHEAEWLDKTGIVRDDLGEYEAAFDLYRRAHELRELRLGPNNLKVALSLDHLGVTQYTLGRIPEARVLFERVLMIREDLLGPEHAEVAGALDNLGTVQFAESRYDEAKASFERSLAIWTAILGPENIEVARPRGNLGAVLLEQGDCAAALDEFEAVLAIQEASLRPDHPDLVPTLANMAQAQRHLGDLEGALVNHRRAVELLESNFGPDHPRLGFHGFHYANALALAGQHEAARVQFERALPIQLEDAAMTPGEIATTRFALARTLWALAEHEPAREQARLAHPLLASDDPLAADITVWLAEHE